MRGVGWDRITADVNIRPAGEDNVFFHFESVQFFSRVSLVFSCTNSVVAVVA